MLPPKFLATLLDISIFCRIMFSELVIPIAPWFPIAKLLEI